MITLYVKRVTEVTFQCARNCAQKLLSSVGQGKLIAAFGGQPFDFGQGRRGPRRACIFGAAREE